MMRRRRSGPRTVATAIDIARRVRRLSADERARPFVYAFAAVLFAALTIGAVRGSDLRWSDARWGLLVPAALIGPAAMVALNGLEVAIQGRLTGVRIEGPSAVRISVLASAANLLPVPGAVLVRAGALMSRGASAREVTRSTVAVSLSWLGVSGVTAGVGLWVSARVGLGALFAVAGATLVAASAAVVARSPDRSGAWWETAIALTAVEAAMVAVGGARLLAAFAGFGIDVSIGQVASLTASNALAAAAGVFPAGLGLREGLLAVMGELVGVSASNSVVAGSFDRVASFLVLGLTAGVVGASGGARRPVDTVQSPPVTASNKDRTP